MIRPTYQVYTFLAPALLSVYQFVTHWLESRLRCRLELRVGQSYADLADADFSFICGLPYVHRTAPRRTPSELHALAAPVLIGDRYQRRPIYFSDVVVHRDSPYHTFADLRGCTWAYNEPESQSGYGITRYHLVTAGETHGFFGKVVQAGFHHTALHWVTSRQIDAAAIDSHLLAVILRDHPTLTEQVRVIASLGPSTIQPFTAAARIPPSLQHDVQAALAAIHETNEARAILANGLIERFVPVDDQAYDDIRVMLAACEQANFLKLM